MKKSLVVSMVLLLVALLAASAFAATTTEDVNVSATVQVKCNPVNAGTMTFDIDPATAVPVTPSLLTQPEVQCTKNRALSVTVASTNNAVSDNTGTFSSVLTHVGCADIPYTLTYNTSPTGAGFGAGNYVDFSVNGSITAGDANAAEYCGGLSYTDTVTLTITY